MKKNDRRMELLATLGRQVEELRSTQGWRDWLAFAGTFRDYSLRNQLLILAQRPDATRVAGFRAWQALGRHVRKGERGIAVLAPSFKLVESDPAETQEQRSLVGFRVVYVFDVAQTDGAALPTLSTPAVRYAPNALFGRLQAVASELGIEVREQESSPNGARGWWIPSENAITLVTSFDQASQTRTLLHELSHALDPIAPDRADSANRAIREIVAESSAWLVGTAQGISMTGASTHYLARWGGSVETLMVLAQRVLTTSGRLSELLAGTSREELAA